MKALPMPVVSRLLIALGFVLLPAALPAHEFWIEPQDYQVESGAPLIADLRNGQHFQGITLGWLANRFSRFEIHQTAGPVPVSGRMGDIPALQVPGLAPGLAVIVHETTPSRLTYDDLDKFRAFVDEKDLRGTLDTHAAKGWPSGGFRESYTRHAKALVQIGGNAEGGDLATGMATEFVAKNSPYRPDYQGQLWVQLLDDAAPRPDALIEVYEKAPSGAVHYRRLRSNAQGMALIKTRAQHRYLLNAVIMRPHPRPEDGALWLSLWASLVFADPRP